jgi:hypothetical protein
MTYQGTVRNGVVVFKAGPPPPPEGADVTVTIAQAPELAADASSQGEDDIWSEMEKFVGRAPELPEDAARNHDHYLYKAPKR